MIVGYENDGFQQQIVVVDISGLRVIIVVDTNGFD